MVRAFLCLYFTHVCSSIAVQTSYRALLDYMTALSEKAPGKPGRRWPQMEIELQVLVFLPLFVFLPHPASAALPRHSWQASWVPFHFCPFPWAPPQSHRPPLCSPLLSPSWPCLWARSLCLRFAFLPLALPQWCSQLTTTARKITAWRGWASGRSPPRVPDLAAPMWSDFFHQVLFSFSLPVFARNAMNLIQ